MGSEKVPVRPGLIPRVREAWFTPPGGLPPRRRWLYIGCAVGFPVALSSHVLLVVLFGVWGVTEMAFFNAGSILFWILMLVFVRRHIQLTLLLGFVEIILHSACCVHFVGWEFSAQYTLLPALIGALLLSGRRWLPHLTGLALIGAFIALYVLSRGQQPIYALSRTALLLGAVINMALVGFALTAAISLSYVQIAEKAELALEREYARSEALLHNVLPDTIAHQLKDNPEKIADGFPQASVLFADLVNFTTFAAALSPERLVSVLGALFSGFDEALERLGAEKIKTIGDAYMAAAGVPVPRADHAEVLVRLGVEMQRQIAAYNREHGSDLLLRIGIHSGPVVAGVIGKKRFLYDLWGDSVNTASRMESHGVPGEIQISDATRALLGPCWICEDRGRIEIKGKGKMRTWLVTGPKECES